MRVRKGVILETGKSISKPEGKGNFHRERRFTGAAGIKKG